jgi:peptidoglycan hydrolase CwlO-like protein
MTARRERMTLEELKKRFEELDAELSALDKKIEELQNTRDNTWTELDSIANQMWEIEAPEAFGKWKRFEK